MFIVKSAAQLWTEMVPNEDFEKIVEPNVEEFLNDEINKETFTDNEIQKQILNRFEDNLNIWSRWN